jgi:polyphosphate:AMP phosphotransferase
MVPEKGKMVFLNRSWYRELFTNNRALDEKEKRLFLRKALNFEENLIAEGVRVLKLFLHISQEEQKKRIKKLQNSPSTRWRVSDRDLEENRRFEKFMKIWEEILHESDTPHAPWICIPANDPQVAAKAALETLRTFLVGCRNPRPVIAGNSFFQGADGNILQRIDLNRRLSEEEYETKIRQLQGQLLERQYDLYRKGKSLVVLFEGWDAAGKGGAIKRLTQGLDPRGFVVHPIGAPNEWERAHPYLWRFWIRLPSRGRIGIFDRSWYGRVLVERVEGFCTEEEWSRAYTEIKSMEAEWIEDGYGIVKFWLHISPEEQLNRFRERETNEEKKWKLTPEDWRNRQKWPEYEKAADEMIRRTGCPASPWTLVEGNDKRFARVKVVETVLAAMENLL